MTDTHSQAYILTLSCPDQRGIVHAVSAFLLDRGGNIEEAAQYNDPDTGLFFMRVQFQAPPQLADATTLGSLFEHTRQQFGMDVHFHAVSQRPRVLLMVSQHGHCLNDLLFRWKSKQLDVDIPAIVSNHAVYADLAASYGIPFHHLPLAGGSSADTKRAQEQQIEALIEANKQSLDAAPAAADIEPFADTIGIDDFAKLDLRVATVLDCKLVDGSDKLLQFTVDLGSETRNIFSGIRKAYADPASLIGRKVIVVANLAPRKMRFGVSQGMILCASGVDDGSGLFLLDSDDGAMLGMRVS